ncbi:hypothetical protein POTOM_010490 [Populus tomentosa]|uniref:Uncharacterized protein n=1 Tax=Populus tomentosa TaxID=118781 RepID=A0A8X8ADP4_POPTO|nr:hypothetical protein POTOM_010490 [Populus tomentosa]
MVALQNLLLSQIMQSIGFLGPAFFLTQLSHVRTPAMAVLCMACSQMAFYFFKILDEFLVSFVDDRDRMHSHSLVSIQITKILAPVMLRVISIFCSWADVF